MCERGKERPALATHTNITIFATTDMLESDPTFPVVVQLRLYQARSPMNWNIVPNHSNILFISECESINTLQFSPNRKLQSRPLTNLQAFIDPRGPFCLIRLRYHIYNKFPYCPYSASVKRIIIMNHHFVSRVYHRIHIHLC